MASAREVVRYIATGVLAAAAAYTALDLAITDSGEQTRRPTHAYRVNADGNKTTRKHDDVVIGFESNQYAELHLSDKTGRYSDAQNQRTAAAKKLTGERTSDLEARSTKHDKDINSLREAKDTLDEALNARDPTYKSE